MNPTPVKPVNRIRVSDDSLRMMKRSSDKDPDYRIACIRDYIRDHKGEVMTTAQFSLAAYGHESNMNYVSKMLKKLIRSGRVTRSKVNNGKPGKAYTYLWHEQRVVDPVRSNGPVSVRLLKFDKAEPSTDPQVTSIDYDWISNQAKEFSWSNNTDSLRDFVKFLSTIVKKES